MSVYLMRRSVYINSYHNPEYRCDYVIDTLDKMRFEYIK